MHDLLLVHVCHGHAHLDEPFHDPLCTQVSERARERAHGLAREGAPGTYALAGMDAQAAELLGERLQAASRAVLHHEVELPARMCV